MSYHDDVFPTDISYGARGGPMFSTTVLELASGVEKRNINWANVRARYNVGYGVRKPEHMDEILSFFYARYGRGYSFPYFDWKDYKIQNQTIGTGDGGTLTFQIIKTYTSGSYSYDRLITKIKAGTLTTLTVNGTPYILGDGGSTGFTLDLTTGIVTFNVAPASMEDIVIEYIEFYVHVRFDTDLMDIQLVTYDAESWTDIILVEIKEAT